MSRPALLGSLLVSLAAAMPAAAVTDCSFDLDADAQVMTLQADCTTTSEPVIVPDGWTLDGNGHSITATGAFVGGVVRAGGATAHVHDLVVAAAGLPCTCHSGDDRIRGIYFNGAGGSIRDTQVLDLNQGNTCGCQEGNGIEVRNFTGNGPVEVLIEATEVSGYQKNGITTNGDVRATIVENTVSGMEPVNYIAQNGIQAGYGAIADIRDNHVDGHWYTGANWGASGILLFEASDSLVRNNHVVNNQLGITVEAWGWLEPDASRNVVRQNQVLESEWGIVIDALAYEGVSAEDSFADDNVAAGNVIRNTSVQGEAGIFVGAYPVGNPATQASARRNRLIANAIEGFAEAIVVDGAEDTKIAGNPRRRR